MLAPPEARAGSMNTPGPFNFPISRAPARAAESPKLSSLGTAPGRLAIFVGLWLKSEAPALQAVTSGSVTRRTPPISTVLRGTRLKHRAKPHKLRQAGVIPAPATIFWEVIRRPVCNTGVFKQA